jgi:hypothetical protein
VADDPDRADQAMCLGGNVELTEEGAAVGARDPRLRVRLHTPHGGEVDDDATLASRQPGRTVPAGLHGDLEVVLAGEADSCRDLGRGRRADDDGRTPIVDRVPQPTRVVVRIVARRDHLANRSAQLIELLGREPRACFNHR